jgi:hypothetical protein
MSNSWPRLGIFEVVARTDAEILNSLVAKLQSGETLHKEDRRKAAWYLRCLAMRPVALKALKLRSRRSSRALDIALDLLVCRELYGRNAASTVAAAWSVSKQTVRQYYAGWKAGAEWTLNGLIGGREGTLRVGRRQPDGSMIEYHWTRRELLEAVHLDLQDRRRAKRRKK